MAGDYDSGLADYDSEQAMVRIQRLNRREKMIEKTSKFSWGHVLAIVSWANVFCIIWGNILGYITYSAAVTCALAFFVIVAILVSMVLWSPKPRDRK